MNSFKEQCIALRKKDKTLDEISALTGRSKSSVYTHIKNVPLSKEKMNAIALQNRSRALRNAQKRKGVSLRAFKPFSTWTPDMVLLVAHLDFDGELTNRTCGYTNRNLALVSKVQTLITTLYNYDPKCHYDPISGIYKIRYYNVSLKNYLENKSQELQKVITELPRPCKREYLRAFFDDEGCMDYRVARNVRQIRGYQNNRDILKIIKSLLRDFDIEAKIKEPNEVVINGKDNLLKFQKEINFSKGVCPNPNRTNALRKDIIEKRQLLDQAIKSFKS